MHAVHHTLLDSLLFTLWMQLKAVGPFWVVGLIVGSLISTYLTQEMIGKVYRMREGSFSLFSATVAALIGTASPLCMYGTIPVIVALGRKGVPQATLTAFMMSSILLNPNIFFLTFALGTPAALWRLGLCVVAGMLSGWLVQVFFKNRQVFDLQKFAPGVAPVGKTFTGDLKKSFAITAPYFVVGILLATLFEVLIPREWVNLVLGVNPTFEVLAAVLISVPVYTCDGAIISLLRTWQEMGLSEGSVVAFLLAGAATKIAKLGAIKIVLGMRNFSIYLAFILIFSFTAGCLINLLA
ncbi:MULTISPECIES: permease [unclassified Desulfovibrio]|uniref:permease n=1 Tax=unclassified Desulfovibrio TaxID=2593640 RepID=UPI002FDAD5B6